MLFMWVEKGYETLFCTLLVYEDDFSKNLSSKVSQSILMCSLLEGTVRGVKAVSLQTQMILLSPTVVTKHKRFGDDALWRIYSVELLELSKGKLFSFPDGGKAMIFCNVLLFGADTPAASRAIGLFETTPCRFCKINPGSLGICIEVSEIAPLLRKTSDISDALLSNSGKAGPPEDLFSTGIMASAGLKRLSPIVAEWPNFRDLDRFVVDVMHALCEGTAYIPYVSLSTILFCSIF